MTKRANPRPDNPRSDNPRLPGPYLPDPHLPRFSLSRNLHWWHWRRLYRGGFRRGGFRCRASFVALYLFLGLGLLIGVSVSCGSGSNDLSSNASSDVKVVSTTLPSTTTASATTTPSISTPAETTQKTDSTDDAGSPDNNVLPDDTAPPDDTPPDTSTDVPDIQAETQILDFTIVQEISHDPMSFTQGLIYHKGIFYESTGAPSGQTSRLYAYTVDAPLSPLAERRVEPGDFSKWIAPLTSGAEVPDSVFAEGLENVEGDLYQLTWRERLVLVWGVDIDSPQSFTPKNAFTYSGEGWGLCGDGEFLYMSNGTGEISRRNPETFEEIDRVTVTIDGIPTDGRLNELECAKGYIWANIWFSNEILRIQPQTGVVTGILDASDLEVPRPVDQGAVLNGIAYDGDTDTFWLTGKYWSRLYQISIS